MLVPGARSRGHVCMRQCGVSGERSYLCVEALGTIESENELDWFLSMGLMWATDLKTGLKG